MMKTLFLIAILAGFAGALAGAHYAPGLRHARLPSHTSVVANGGRAEQFLIRLPADRLTATDGPAGGLRAVATGAAMTAPAALYEHSVLVEHFKVRDAAGDVIGVAARHWTTGEQGANTTWSVLIPSRGAFALAAPGEPSGVVEAALARGGYDATKAWNGDVVVAMAGADSPGELVAASGEFDGLTGTYTENWRLAGVDEAGRLLGTVVLETITSRTP